jgi:threo-3-hydroxy-L-aspartate ammonia-lyase
MATLYPSTERCLGRLLSVPDESTSQPVTLDDVRVAADRLSGVAHRTPVMTSRTLDSLSGATLLLKCENFQRSGTFKFRGAYNAISSLPDAERRRGVCTISSGNHAQALALSAQELDVPAVILMPEDAPELKLNATRGYGAEVVLYDRYSISQYEAGQKLRQERGLAFISSHDDPLIAAGAGTAMLELVDDAESVDVLVAPIGGGGGMSGYATVAKALLAGVQVVGAEPAASRLASRSLAAGSRVEIDVPRTIADGQQLTVLGRFTFEVLRALVDEVVAVEDAEIVAAMTLLFERMKLVTEPSGAIALAAVLSGRFNVEGKRVGVIVSGGNIGATQFARLIGAP